MCIRDSFFSKGIGSTYFPTGDTCAALEDCPAEAEVCQSGYCVRIEPSTYYTDPRATPAARTYGFIHESEDACNYSLDAWNEWGMGMCGGPLSVEDAPDDFDCAHVLMTNAEPTGDGYHGSMGSDGAMAKDSEGYPLNQRALMYMMLAQ